MRETPSRRHPAEGVLIFRDQPTIVFATICSRERRSHLANDSIHNALWNLGAQPGHGWLASI